MSSDRRASTLSPLASAIPFQQRSLVRLLHDCARACPHSTVTVIDGQPLTWAGLERAATDVAAALRGVGVVPGDVVGQMTGNRTEHAVALFAIAMLGAVECPVNSKLRGESLRHVLTHSHAKVLLLEKEHLERVVEALPAGEGPELLVVVGGEHGGGSGKSGRAVASLDDLDRRDGSPHRPGPGDPATILYTSGTTGPAKGVVLPHNFAFSTAELKAAAWGLGQEDVLFSSLPLFHANARYSTLLTGALIGARSVIAPRFSARAFWDEVRDAGATEVGVVGTVPAILLNQPESDRDRDHEVRCMHGAGGLSMEQREEFERRFALRLVVGFAMSETSHVATASPDDPRRYTGSGRALPAFDLEIVDEHDRAVPTGTVGQLLVRPRRPHSMFLEYFRDPEATLEAFRNLWFHTGDLGRFDGDGYFHWAGRQKDALRRGGEMISAYDVEHALERHSSILECAAVGVPADLGEDEVKVFVVPRDGARLDFDRLEAHCRQVLPDFAVPRYYAVVADLPRTASHKVAKHQLADAVVTATWDSKAHVRGGGRG